MRMVKQNVLKLEFLTKLCNSQNITWSMQANKKKYKSHLNEEYIKQIEKINLK